MNQDSRFIVIILVVGALGAGGYFWWRNQQTPPAPAAPIPKFAAPSSPFDPSPDVRPATPPPPPAEPAIKHPITAPARRTPLPPLAEADAQVRDALIELMGKKGVLSFLNADGFVRRFVTTVDNLANETAPVLQWPVNRTPGRFLAESPAGAISPQNAERYTPLLRFALAVDTRKAVGIYARLYPLFQQAYEELGFPGKYFNDRAIEVIDHLLATPEPTSPVRVRLVQVTDAAGRTRPGTLYQFEDPSLEARSAGQKLLLRMGPQNAAQVKAKLSEIRGQITQGKAPR